MFTKLLEKEKRLQKAKEHALSKGGECLSEYYTNSETKLIWKCSNPEHPSWNARYNKIQQGGWCPSCGKINSLKNLSLVHKKKKTE